MIKTLSNDKSNTYNLNVKEDVVVFLTFKFITRFIDHFTLEMKSQSIFYYILSMPIVATVV
jgi:hypothetical protein